MEGVTESERSFAAEENEAYRLRAKVLLGQLEESVKNNSQSAASSTGSTSSSWIREESDTDWSANRSERCQFFDTHGFLIVSKFVDDDTIHSLKEQMKELVATNWDPSSSSSISTFGTDEKSNEARGDYFLESSDKVHYFAELHTLDETTKQLKSEYQNDKLAALNKAGHGLHLIPGPFQTYTKSEQVRELVSDLGWKDPSVPQSMYIFKQPYIGGAVNSHQDSCFLHTAPKQTCLGLWLALDDATLENGCLWVRPGSHKEPLRRQFIRNPEYFEKNNEDAPKLIFQSLQEEEKEGNDKTDGNVDNGQPSASSSSASEKNGTTTAPWEGDFPEFLDAEGFVPVEVQAGDLVCFCGTLDHLSLPNYSNQQRHTFQLHLIEGNTNNAENNDDDDDDDTNTITWSKSNWLQYPKEKQFMKLT